MGREMVVAICSTVLLLLCNPVISKPVEHKDLSDYLGELHLERKRSADDPQHHSVKEAEGADLEKRLPSLPYNKRDPENTNENMFIAKAMRLLGDFKMMGDNDSPSKRVPGLPWDKRVPGLPWDKRVPGLPWDKRVPGLPWDKRVPGLPWDKRVPGLPWDKRVPGLPWDKRVPGLPWDKREPNSVENSEEGEVDKRAPALPWDKRQNNKALIKELVDILKSLKEELADKSGNTQIPDLPNTEREEHIKNIDDLLEMAKFLQPISDSE